MNRETDNQKILGNCPSCQRLMQIPVVTDVASVAKCPHCQSQIRVRDLLASAVPEAEIIDGKEKSEKQVSDYVADRQRVYDDSEPKTREKFEVPNQLYAGASRRNRKKRVGSRRSSSRGNSSRDSFARQRSGNNGGSENSRVDTSPTKSSSANTSNVVQRTGVKDIPKTASATSVNGAATTSSSSAAPNSIQQRRAAKPVPVPTPRQRSSSSRGRRSSDMDDDEVELGLTDVIKFLVGGMIAAPLAYLALLWVSGVDPFGMAGTFERISPAIIPDSMRSESVADQPRSGFAPPTGDASSLLFESSSDDVGFESDFEEEGLPLPSLDPDLVR